MINDIFWGLVKIAYGVLIVAAALAAILLAVSLALGVTEIIRDRRRRKR